MDLFVPLFTAVLLLNGVAKAQGVQFQTRPAATVAASELAVLARAAKEMERGNEAVRRGEWHKAIAHFEAAVSAYSQYAVAYNNLGIAYLKSGQVEKAITAFDRAIQLNDRLSMAYVNEARLLHIQGRSADAEPLLKKVLSYEPRYGEALLLLSFVEFRRGKYDEAVGHARDALLLDAAQYALAHFVLAMALQAKNDHQNAASEYRAFLKQSPHSPYAARAQARLNQLLQESP